jgi:hypothetical protein
MAVAAMGWETLCSSTEPGVDRAQFMRIYNGYRDTLRRDRNLASLPAPRVAGAVRVGEPQHVGVLLAAVGGGSNG